MWVGEEFFYKLEVVKRSFDRWKVDHDADKSEVDHDAEYCQVTDASDFGFSHLKLVTDHILMAYPDILLPIPSLPIYLA